MRFIDEYRDAEAAQRYVEAIARRTTKCWTIMEVCGGQTHAIVRFGVDELLPQNITLIHGPGCPVCVTPVEMLDKALEIVARPEVIFCSFGDMLRVPGTADDLLAVKARGGNVRIVYSPMDALLTAQAHPHKEVVFFAVGFETTAPANAMAVYQAERQGLENFSLLVSHVLVPPAMEAMSPRRIIVSRDFSPPAMSARSWDTPNTSHSPVSMACRLWSPALSHWTSCRASTCA
jgi:hydrogenase expression/formation protein HypD